MKKLILFVIDCLLSAMIPLTMSGTNLYVSVDAAGNCSADQVELRVEGDGVFLAL